VSVPACRYCRQPAVVATVTRDWNRRVSDRAFTLARCTACGLLFLADPPADLARYYEGGYHRMPASVEAMDRAPALGAERYKIDLLRRFVASGDLLEIGPSIGFFCRLAQRAAFKAHAIEMDAASVDFLRTVLGVETTRSADPAAALAQMDRRFDAACLWHSIEHLPEPWRVIEAVARALKPGGVLAIATPNPDAWQAGIMGARWPHLDQPRHLFLLPRPWLLTLAGKLGLTLELSTTRDAGSLQLNRVGWAMRVSSAPSSRIARALLYRGALQLARLAAPWDGREGAGAAYTLVLRKPT